MSMGLRLAALRAARAPLQGYRSIWHTLQLRGKRVPRIVVQELLWEIDPEGSELQKAHRLKKRKYHNPGPNYA